MNAHAQYTHNRILGYYKRRNEYVDDYEFPSEVISHLDNMRNIQCIRALMAESEYVRSKIKHRTYELEFQQLTSHVLGKINEIQMCTDQQRQDLKSEYQNTSSLLRWRDVEKKANKDVYDFRSQIIASRQALRLSEAAVEQAIADRRLTERRLLKFDEILKVTKEGLHNPR